MRRVPIAVAAFLLLTVVLGMPAAAAASGALKIVTSDVDQRVVRLTVSAPRSLAGEDLAREFVVVEGDQVVDATAAPVGGGAREVALVIDTSGSMAGAAMTSAKQAATTFVRSLPSAVRVAVVDFGDEPKVRSGFTDGTDSAVRAIDRLRAKGETALYDAVELALAQFSPDSDAAPTVVLLTDGADTVSGSSLGAAYDSLRASQAGFFAIKLETSDSRDKALRALASAADGEVLGADDPRALATVYDQVAASLRNQYVLTYPSDASGRTDVAVALPAHPGVAAALETVTLPAVPARPAPEEPAPAPAPRAAVAELPPLLALLDNPWVLRGAAVAVFTAALVVLLPLSGRRASHGRRGTGAAMGLAPRPTADHRLTEIGDWAKSRVDRALRRRGLTQRLNARLEHAGILLRPAEFVLAVAGTASLLMITGTLTKGSGIGVVLGLLTVPGAKLFLDLKTSRRRKAFAAQLGDTLQMMAGSLRSGYGLLQAVDSVAREADSPSSDEFRRLVMETRLGRDLEVTLHAMAKRVGSDDFKWVMQAIEIHREVGGDLSVVLDEVGTTIRERDQVFRQVKALSAEGRLSAMILLLLPFIVVGGITMTNPSYMNELYTTSVGRILMAVGLTLLGIGALWITKVVKPKF